MVVLNRTSFGSKEAAMADFVPIMSTPDGRVRRAEAARFLGFKPKTLAEWHRQGIGPASLLVGGRRFYRLDDLREYASAAHLVHQHGAADLLIKLHSLHPPPPQNRKGLSGLAPF